MGNPKDQVSERKITDRRESKVIAVPIPPDGGYGWVIVFASFTLSMILDGICFTIGIFMNEFLDYFEGSKSETAWVGSVMNGMYMIMGPIVSGLCNRFGCRIVATAGCIFTCFSLIVATFMPNLSLLTLTCGAMTGIGFGFFYLPAIIMVGFYFEKKRALATGIAVCGSGIGGAVFAPFCTYLIDLYAWKGALLILAGVTLNGMVLTLLFRPVEATIVTTVMDTEAISNMPQEPHTRQRNNSSNAYFCSLSEITPTKNQTTSATDENPSLTKSCDQIWIAPTPSRHQNTAVKLDVSRPAFRKDAFHVGGSLLKIPEYQESKEEETEMKPYICSVMNMEPLKEAEKKQKSLQLRDKKGSCSDFLDGLWKLKDGFNIGIKKRITFLVYGSCCLLCMLGFFVPFAYIPRLAIEHGFSSQEAANVISIMSITNVVGRVLVGFFADRPWVDSIMVNNVALIIGGVAVSCIPHFPSMVPMTIASICFGFAIAAFVSLRSIIMVELMGLENLSNAFGFVTLCQGLSSFVGTPIAGALVDATGDFHAAFYMAGAALLLSGVICIPLRQISVWEAARLKRRSKKELDKDSATPSEVDMLMDNSSRV